MVAKSAGININLWAGLVILAGGAIFLAWARLRPLRTEDLERSAQDESCAASGPGPGRRSG